MKLAILSRAPRTYSTRRLRTAALDRSHQVKVLNTLLFAIDLTGPEPDLLFRGRRLSDYDAVLPRIGSSITYFGTAVVRQFEQMDVYTPNTANGISNSRDKLRATQILSRHNIGMPATTFVRNRADVRPAIERVGGAPVVIKLLEGTQGIGVILAPGAKVAEAIIETLHSTKQNVLIQSFVSEDLQDKWTPRWFGFHTTTRLYVGGPVDHITFSSGFIGLENNEGFAEATICVTGYLEAAPPG